MLTTKDDRIIIPTKCFYWWDKYSGIFVFTLEDSPPLIDSFKYNFSEKRCEWIKIEDRIRL